MLISLGICHKETPYYVQSFSGDKMSSLVVKGQLLIALSCALKRAKTKSTLQPHPALGHALPSQGESKETSPRGSHPRLNHNWKTYQMQGDAPAWGKRG